MQTIDNAPSCASFCHVSNSHAGRKRARFGEATGSRGVATSQGSSRLMPSAVVIVIAFITVVCSALRALPVCLSYRSCHHPPFIQAIRPIPAQHSRQHRLQLRPCPPQHPRKDHTEVSSRHSTCSTASSIPDPGVFSVLRISGEISGS